jgi:hypothetical protein
MKFLGALTAAGLALALLATAGCQTASLEDAAPKPADKPASAMQDIAIPSPVPLPRGVDELPQQDFVSEGIRDTGTYPLVGTPRQAANRQITPQEQAAMQAEMERLKAEQAGGGMTRAQYEARLKQLRKIAETHAEEAEREIVK